MIDLVVATKTTAAIVRFVTGSGFMAALGAIGGVHATAAKGIMDNLDKAANEREAINRALTHLEAAHIAFQKEWMSGTVLRRYKREQEAYRDAWTCCLIATCHKHLGDHSILITRALDNAKAALDFIANMEGYESILHIANPFNMAEALMAGFNGDVLQEIKHAELASIRSGLLSE